jgi:protocatechuate 3,4-dioxygenase beta subunit
MIKETRGSLSATLLGLSRESNHKSEKRDVKLTDNIRLVDEITFKVAAETKDVATASAILGPFYRHDAPTLENGATIVHGVDDGEITYMHGKVIDLVTKEPVAGAWIDVWQASTNGLYEQQDKDQVDCNLRGKFKTDSNGYYGFYCLRPTPYPVPNDGKESGCTPQLRLKWSLTALQARVASYYSS